MADAEGRGRTAPVEAWWPRAVRRELERRNLKQTDLAQQLGVSDATLSRACGRNVNIDVATRLARILELPPPVAIARTMTEAYEIERAIKFARATQEAIRTEADAAAASLDVKSRDADTPRPERTTTRRVRKHTHE